MSVHLRGKKPTLEVPGRDGFIWAAGIEDTFICSPDPKTGRILDEYGLTEHYQRWPEDLALMASLGVTAARYGVPWHRVNPRPGEYDWTWMDRVLDRMVNVHGIEPIVDLVHYGTPAWLDRAFAHPDYPQLVAEYAAAFSEHYRGLCSWFTPLNEPRITAWYCGRLGWWPPHLRSWHGFATVLAQICRGICLTQKAVASVLPHAIFVHVDATDLYYPADEGDRALVREAMTRQHIVFLALDLVIGRVGESHPLRGWLRDHGLPDSDVEWFRSNKVTPDAIGYNMYPMYSHKEVRRANGGGIRVQIRKCWSEVLAALTKMYAERYAPIPIMVAETASDGPTERRERWIRDSVRVIEQARAGGYRVIGYTYWPLYSLIAWAYQRGNRHRDDYLLHMGLWDLGREAEGLMRTPTAAADAYRAAVAAGVR